LSGIAFEVLFMLLLLLANGVFAMSEMAVVSSRKTKLQQLANEGNKRASAALELANNPNDFLSTIQIGITLIGTLIGALGGATIAERLALWLRTIPALVRYSDAISLAVVVLAITYLSLILGELAPKRLALYNPERIASAMTGPMRFLSRAAFPAVRLLSFSTDAVIKLFGIKPPAESSVSEEELQVLLQEGTDAGVFEESEQDMVQGVFRLGERRVSALMTPWTEIVWLDINDSPEDIRMALTESHYSRFPVCEGSLDQVRGIVQAKDLLAHVLAGESLDLKGALQKAQFVPESTPAAKALEMFKRTHTPFALVINEYGGIAGLVTMTDIVEEILGDMEPGDPEAVQRQDGSWLLDGMMLIEDLKEHFQIGKLPEEGEYQTLGGFVMMQMGRVPTAGDHFDWDHFRFEVMDMDGNRVDKVLVQVLPKENPPAE
jgi:putative hemolysin